MSVNVKDGWKYAEDIISEKISSCSFVKQACKRFLNDFDNPKLFFNEKKAQEILDFYDCVPHIKGKWAGAPIEPSLWQSFILINLFGWYWEETKTRRYRTAYIEVARKNGKSTIVAPIGLYMLNFDDEAGAEVYSAATSRDQARIVFDTARNMARSSSLKKFLEVYQHSICNESTNSFFKPLASDSDTLEGKNTHCAIIDELHAHKNRRVYDVLELSLGAREQPLLVCITTAGDDRTGICYEVRSYCTKVLSNIINDDSFFGVIYTVENPDNWLDPEFWIHANPNLSITPKLEDMKRLAQKAKQTPSAASEFKRKRLNIWCEGEHAYFNMQAFNDCPMILEDSFLKTLPCYLAIDLSSKRDLTVIVALFVDENRNYFQKAKIYLPEAVVDIRMTGKAYHIQKLYRQWSDNKFMKLTDGQIIDYKTIYQDIKELAKEYNVLEIAFDPWGSTQIATQLQEDGLQVVQVQQSVKNFSEAMKELDALIIDKRFHHEHNPVLSWMFSNVNARVDRNDNVFPNKLNDENKIDGAIATLMALNRALLNEKSGSIYEKNDLLVL